MNVKIEQKNKEKVEEVLAAAQGKASVRTVDFTALLELATSAEKELDRLEILKKNRKDCELIFSEGPATKPRKYIAEATWVTLKRGAQEWFLVDAKRDRVFQGGRWKLMISKAAREQKILDITRMTLA